MDIVMRIKVIKTQDEYKEALTLLEKLMDSDPRSGTEDAEKMEVLATLIQTYETEMFPDELPDPIDAILFRMEQLGLSQKDLVEYIGSKSKVSEILSKKRPLTVSMMKSLGDYLGIPAKVMLNQKKSDENADFTTITKLPIKELVKYGYVTADVAKNAKRLNEKIHEWIEVLGGEPTLALLSRTYYVRSPKPMSQETLLLWVAKIVASARDIDNVGNFNVEQINKQLMSAVVDLSDETDGIEKALALLKEKGVLVIAEPHLPKTYLDGAAIMLPNQNPIIGLTLRHDRLDNFWFTLLHELAHIALHYGKGVNLFYDNTEVVDFHNIKEKEADDLAIEVMVPRDTWKKSPASILPSKEAAIKLAKELSIHPAIVAGKMRYENNYFTYLNSLVAQGEVRKHFSDRKW